MFLPLEYLYGILVFKIERLGLILRVTGNGITKALREAWPYWSTLVENFRRDTIMLESFSLV
jgi:hypothetical protein